MGAGFGDLLKEWRGRAGKSMGDIARYLSVSITYVSDVERGVRPPYVTEKIMKVAHFLNIPPHGIEQLLHAAAQWRGTYELNVGTQQHNDVAAALMRGWSSLSENQLQQIQAIVSRRRTGEHMAVNTVEEVD